jgi:hypothetical protein
VIPEDHRLMIGGIILITKAQKRFQRTAIAHIDAWIFLYQLKAVAIVK